LIENPCTPAAKVLLNALRMDWEFRPMEILLWLAILLAFGVILWLAAPYHNRIIGNRDTALGKSWDDPML